MYYLSQIPTKFLLSPCSLAQVQSGAADFAAIDCVTLALIRKHDPQRFQGLRVLGWTEKCPALPYVTPADATGIVPEKKRITSTSVL